ncbi:MAG: hypothetical protein Q4C12_00075 [Clostridia bacterium]|nr:hypothetical protein [Clostridia bacterium]
MYNENQKRNFISEHTSSDKTSALIVQIFNWFEKYEAEWGMDLSQQTAEKLQPVVNGFTGVRSKSTELVLIILTEYVKWCGRNGYDVSKGIYDVRVNTIHKIQNQMVASPLHLKSKLDEFFEPTEKETVDVIYRVFLWMAFAGLDDKDAIRVSIDDVDLDDLHINFEGHSYEIYKECRDEFEKACSLTDFQYEHQVPYYVTRRERASGRLLMRGIRSPSVDLKTLRPIINKKFAVNDKDENETLRQKSRISYKRIYLSGIFYRAYEQERAGLPVDFSEVIAAEIARKEKTKKYTVTKTRTLTTISHKIEKEYLADYEKWKCAFAI